MQEEQDSVERNPVEVKVSVCVSSSEVPLRTVPQSSDTVVAYDAEVEESLSTMQAGTVPTEDWWPFLTSPEQSSQPFPPYLLDAQQQQAVRLAQARVVASVRVRLHLGQRPEPLAVVSAAG